MTSQPATAEVPFAFVRVGVTEPWHLVRGLGPLQAVDVPLVAVCGRQVYAASAADGLAAGSRVCTLCHSAAKEYRYV